MSCFKSAYGQPCCAAAFILSLAGMLFHPISAACGESELIRLTFDGRIKRNPVVWPGGKSIVYSTVTDEGFSRLMRLNLEDGSTTLFQPESSLPDRELAVSASGSVFAYVYVTTDGQRGRVIVKDTSRSATMTLEPGSFGLWPTLSPDGRHIALTIDAGPIVAVDLSKIESSGAVKIEPKSEGAVSRLTEEGARYGDLWPKYSPDGSRIVFSSRRDDDFEIYLMNADGTAQQRLTTSPGIDAHPAFSPDGKRIAFTSNRDRNYEIYTMKIDGSDVRRITSNGGRDDFACWHHDGTRLVIVSQVEGRCDLYFITIR